MVLAPAVAAAARADDPPGVTLVRDGRGIAELPADTTTSTPAPTPAPAHAPAAAATDEDVVVVEGDNLWTIAAARLARTSGRSPTDITDTEVAPYWIRVCDENRARLASGDPNVIVPGEHIVLPAV